MNPMIPISSSFIELFPHKLPNKVFRPQKLAGPMRVASKIMKNSAIDSFWWVENDSVILEGSIELFWLNKFKKNDLKWKLIGNQGPLSAFWRPLNLRGRVYQKSSYRWSRAPLLPHKSFSAIQLHHEPPWGTFVHPGPWIGTIYLGQKLGRTHPLMGKTLEVCFSMYFNELIKILKEYCQNIAWEPRYQIG